MRGPQITQRILEVAGMNSWRIGLEWLTDKGRWPSDIKTVLQDSLAETEERQDFCTMALVVTDELDVPREKLGYWKTKWELEFSRSSKTVARRERGRWESVTAEEKNKTELFWVKQVRARTTADKLYDKMICRNWTNNQWRIEHWNIVVEHRGTTQFTYQRYTEKPLDLKCCMEGVGKSAKAEVSTLRM